MKKLSLFNKSIVILILSVFFTRLAFMPYVVNGESMAPTLKDKQFGVGIKTTFSDIHRFDIVVISQGDRYLIKRVIGLPGEFLEFRDNKLYVDHEEQPDVYAFGNTENFKVKIGENEYFCLGDNRENSQDSRDYGNFSKELIVAKCF